MTAKEKLLYEVEQVSDDLVEEVLNFLLFTKTKQLQGRRSPENHTRISKAEQAIEYPENLEHSIWDNFSSFTEDIPEDVLAQLPTDGVEQHDHHYIYGTPKRS
jgi:hypothetical protein